MKISFYLYVLIAGLIVSCSGQKEHKQYPLDANISLDSTMLAVTVVADSLVVPWDLQFIDNERLIYTEIEGIISQLDLTTGKKYQLVKIDEVYQKRTLGLLGMGIHPDFRTYPYVFVSYNTKVNDDIFSKLVRYTYKKDTLTNPKVLLTIPGSTGHNGARIIFSRNGKLLWATGDAHSKTFAQDSTSLNGKILRINIDGTVPDDNPIKGSFVWAWGFRNMQGLTVSNKGFIYTSEHGDAIEDEVNLIEPLQNYGWPQIEGKHDTPAEKAIASKNQRTEPVKSWTPVIAPAGLAFYNSNAIPEWKNTLLLATLKSQSLRVLKLDETGKQIISEQIFLEKHYGRLRAITVSPLGDIYITTSNKDWNPQPGFPKPSDDRILKISKVKKALKNPLKAKKVEVDTVLNAASLYNSYCASCHKENGLGVPGTFPPLAGAEQVTGAKEELIKIVLNGLSGKILVKGETYDQQMPAFDFLSDEELAKILTYVRRDFGNNKSEVNASDIKKTRTN